MLFLRSIFGVLICSLGVYLSIGFAKSGADIFYYAMAFASPGTALELLQGENTYLAPPPSTDFDLAEDNAQAEEERDLAEEVLPEETPKEIPEVPENRRGKVTETAYSKKEGGVYVGFEHAIIKNCTHHSAEKIKSMLKTPHNISLSTESENSPQVLIYHTHATEGFEPADRGYFDLNATWRSTDNSENMVAVGAVLKETLESAGIAAIQDFTQHDDPSYNGSYNRSASTIKKQMAENPGLQIFIDLHRDAIEPSKSEIIKPTAVIDGKKAAQIMIIAGCDDGTMNMPNYWENLRFAAALASKLEELYPGICRPILFDYRRYNMDLSPNLLLIEIGATGNTLEEAKYSAELLGRAMAELFTEGEK